MGIFDPQTDLSILPEPETVYWEDADDLEPCEQRRLVALGRAKLRSAVHGASDSPVSTQTTCWKQYRKILIGFRRS